MQIEQKQNCLLMLYAQHTIRFALAMSCNYARFEKDRKAKLGMRMLSEGVPKVKWVSPASTLLQELVEALPRILTNQGMQ